MARERMAKLIKYDHFQSHIGHIITYFMISQMLHQHNIILSYRHLGSWPSDEDVAYTVRFAAPRRDVEKNWIRIEH